MKRRKKTGRKAPDLDTPIPFRLSDPDEPIPYQLAPRPAPSDPALLDPRSWIS